MHRIIFKRRGGFSLIELVVVLMVLAIVSGLVVTLAGWVRRSANYAALSHNQGSLGGNIELFRTTFGNDAYPERFDSLLLADGSFPSYLNSELTAMLEVDALTADEAACLTHGGADWEVMDHEADSSLWDQGNPGNSAVTPRVVTSGGNAAFIDTTTPSSNGAALLAQLYPDGVPTDVRLVAFGVGPGNAAIGKTMQSVPIDTRIDNSEVYGRFIAVFAVYSPRAGRRAQLKAVLSARGRTQNSGLTEFWQSTTPE